MALPEQSTLFPDGCGETVFTPHGERLTGAIDDPRVTWFAGASDHGVRIKWPPGYIARFRPRLEVVDPSGVVVAREGDRLRNSRHSVKMNDLFVCPLRHFDVTGSKQMLRWIGNDPGATSRQPALARPVSEFALRAALAAARPRGHPVSLLLRFEPVLHDDRPCDRVEALRRLPPVGGRCRGDRSTHLRS